MQQQICLLGLKLKYIRTRPQNNISGLSLDEVKK